MWDHVFVCEKGHYIPFDQLHPGIKVYTLFLVFICIICPQVNSFPSTAALDRKNKLWNFYKKFQIKIGKKACNFIPENYNLPQQEQQLKQKV